MDGTADISVKEQVSICFLIVQKNFGPQELFCAVFNTSDTIVIKARKMCEDSTVVHKHSYNRKSHEHCTYTAWHTFLVWCCRT